MKYSFLFINSLLIYCAGIAQEPPAHIVIIVLENHSYSQVAGNPLTPYINSLLNDPSTAVLTQSYGLTHPSQPNYIQLFSGSAQDVIDNSLPAVFPFVTPNLGASLIQKGFSFTGYSEDLPLTGSNVEISGDYVRKHNPWVNWQGTGANGIPALQNQPFTSFPTNFSTLPTVAFVIPNQANDMHNSSISVSFPLFDAWLRNNLDAYIQWGKTNNSVFMITFDEDDGSHGNNILTSITGENVKGGSYHQPVTHYNVLRTIEELYKLPYAGASADSTAIQNIWLTPVCNGGSKALQSNIAGIDYHWQQDTGTGFANINDDIYYAGTHTDSLQLSDVPSAWYGYRFRCMVDSAYSNPITLRIAAHWFGSVSAEWENPLNWDCGLLPDSNTDVILNKNSNVVLGSAALVRSISLSEGVQFTQNGNGHLTIIH